MIKLLLLLLICFPSYAMDVVAIKKSLNDKRDYQGLILSNGLKVLLISDPSLAKNAVALDVQVGSIADPDNRLGLAHFVGHMLDLGTEKYPKATSFADFMNEHGGYYNASTEPEYTKYIFNVDANCLDEALDRFAQFFIAPLFKQELINRERNAIESEYRLRVKDDNLRMHAAMVATSNAKHPYNRFGMGTIETLGEIAGQPAVQQDLGAFFNQHYSADKMTLLIAGPQKLNQLQSMVAKNFNAIPVRDGSSDIVTTPALDQEFAQDLLVKSLGEQRELNLLFKLDSLHQDYNHKSMDFIIYLLELTNKGSLKDYLWQNNWIIDAHAYHENVTVTQDILKINFKLSANGEKNIEEITKLTLQYIEYLLNNTVESKYFEQLKNANLRNANFKDNEAAMSLVQRYSRSLHMLPLADIVIADDFIPTTSFDADKVQQILSALKPQNMRRIYLHKNALTKSVERWYSVGYSLTPYTAAQLALWAQPAKVDFAIPDVNNLLPENFKIYGVSGNISVPGIILQSQQLQLWHKQDNHFKQPKISLKFLLRCMNAEDAVEDALKLSLTAQTIDEQLQQHNSAFNLAGIKYHVTADPQGIVLQIEMFSDKVKDVLEIITNFMVDVQVSEQRLETAKDQIKSKLLNQNFEPLVSQALNSLFQIIHKPSWSTSRKLAYINKITVDDVQDYWSQLIAKTKITALAVGNITDLQAISVAKFFIAKINPDTPQNRTYAAIPQLIEYQANDHYGFEFSAEHHDHALASYVQTTETGKLPVVKMILLNSMIEAPFYEQLRTKEQLGYAVFSFPHIVKEHAGLIFIVESPIADPVMLNGRINEFIKSYHNKLDEMTIPRFEQYKAELKSLLLQRNRTMLEDAHYYWSKLLDGTNDFNFKKELAVKLANIKLQDVRNFYKNNFLTNQRSANVIAYTKIKQKNIADDYIPISEK